MNFFNLICQTKVAILTVKIRISVKNKKKTTLFHIYFESLTNNMAIFLASVESLSSKITGGKTVQTMILSLLYKTNSFSDFIQNNMKHLLKHVRMV